MIEEAKEKSYILYRLICPIENKVRYVGITGRPKRREAEHRSYACNQSNFKIKAWKSRLKNLNIRAEFEPIITDLSLDQALEKEIWWINYYGMSNLYNLSPGGIFSLITERHNSQILKGKHIRRVLWC